LAVTPPDNATPPQAITEPRPAPGAGYTVLAVVFLLLGGLFLASAISLVVQGDIGAAIVGFVFAAAPIFLAVSIFRGAAFVLKFVAWMAIQAARRAEAARVAAAQRAEAARLQAERDAADAAEWMEKAKAYLDANRTGGVGVVALRQLEAGARRLYPDTAEQVISDALKEIDLDRSTLSSPRFGYVTARSGGSVEIFRDFIIHGDEAHDVEPTTRGRIYVDGVKQVSSTVVTDQNNKQRIVEQVHDLRTAQLQFTSATWTKSVPINPDDANDVRTYIDRLNTHVEGLSMRGATVEDMRAMVDSILEANGQPPAEKLQQLSNLRFERLLSDEEFERAKTRILGI